MKFEVKSVGQYLSVIELEGSIHNPIKTFVAVDGNCWCVIQQTTTGWSAPGLEARPGQPWKLDHLSEQVIKALKLLPDSPASYEPLSDWMKIQEQSSVPIVLSNDEVSAVT